MLLGRVTEQRVIADLLNRARAGTGGGLLLHGEPGIGKTALLDYTAQQAGDLTVLRTCGVEPERSSREALPFRAAAVTRGSSAIGPQA